MFAFTTKKVKNGKPIAINEETREVIRLVDTSNDPYSDEEDKTITTKIGTFVPLPTKDRCDRIYLAGATGVGKSYQINKYLMQYKKIFPNKKIFLFSDAEEDKLLDVHKPVRILLNESLVENPIQTKELENSITIFDDVDSTSDKKIRNAVTTLYNSILAKGSSKNNIQLILTNHQPCDYQRTRNVLLNSNYFCFFPYSPMGLELAFKKFGFTKEQVKRLLSLKSRSVYLHLNYPQYYIAENEISLL